MTFEEFRKKAISDENLKKQIKSTKSVDEFIELARANGVEITKESLQREVKDLPGLKAATDDDLGNVAGGSFLGDFWEGFKIGFCDPVSTIKIFDAAIHKRPICFNE